MDARRGYIASMVRFQDPPEAFSRVKIDALLKDVGWELTDGRSVRFEYTLPDGTKADYVLCDRHGRAHGGDRSQARVDRSAAGGRAGQRLRHASSRCRSSSSPTVRRSGSGSISARRIRTRSRRSSLRRIWSGASRRSRTRVDPLTVPIDTKIAGRDYQTECIETLCREMAQGRRKLLVEMATGTGKTRTAAAFIKRLFQANAITRVLFLVDRITLAKQTEDAFAEHLRGLSGLCAEGRPPVPGREADHDHHPADHGQRLSETTRPATSTS